MCAFITSPFLNRIRKRRQYGASMVEFAVVAIPVIAMGLGAIELTHWFFTRQALKLALLEAGRSAITNHINPDHIIQSFETALQPLYAAPKRSDTQQRVHNALSERITSLNQAPWQITVLSPSASAYKDFAQAGLSIKGANNLKTINNNYLAEQHERNRAKQGGWLNGNGPASGQNIYEANSLVMHLYWPHKPLLSLSKPILKALGNASGNYAQRTFAGGYLPIARQITMVMQSHPVNWGNHSSAKVLYAGMLNESQYHCKGWLCKNQLSEFKNEANNSESGQNNTAPEPSTNNVDGNNNGTETTEHPPFIDNPECGVTLCCL